jgi:hypothetical protein
VTFPDLGAELDRMFPHWRTWNRPDTHRRGVEKEGKPTIDEQFKAFVRKELEEIEGTEE